MHGGLSPDLNSMEQIRRVMRPTDVSQASLILWSHKLYSALITNELLDLPETDMIVDS